MIKVKKGGVRVERKLMVFRGKQTETARERHSKVNFIFPAGGSFPEVAASGAGLSCFAYIYLKGGEYI